MCAHEHTFRVLLGPNKGSAVQPRALCSRSRFILGSGHDARSHLLCLFQRTIGISMSRMVLPVRTYPLRPIVYYAIAVKDRIEFNVHKQKRTKLTQFLKMCPYKNMLPDVTYPCKNQILIVVAKFVTLTSQRRVTTSWRQRIYVTTLNWRALPDAASLIRKTTCFSDFASICNVF